MGGVTAALASSARKAGAELHLGSPVERITVDGGAVAGVALVDGRELVADTVLSNADARRTLIGLVGRELLDRAFVDAVEAIDYGGTMARVHLAVAELPQYEAEPSKRSAVAPVHRAFALLGANLDAFRRAHEAQRCGRIAEQPVLELSIQSTDDPTLSPPGTHTVNLGVMHVPFTLADGSWDDHRERLGDIVVARLCQFAPNLEHAIIARRVTTPQDWERTYGLTQGNIYQGAMGPRQILGSRPLPGWARYRMPIRGLYLCGASTHPGGAVNGAPGHNAAHAAIVDLRTPPTSHDEWLDRARCSVHPTAAPLSVR
jgi:phytoene dehydrogenase-like protein